MSAWESQPAHIIVGREGEELALGYVKSKGLHVLERNVRVGRDEIDAICRDPIDDVLVFLEVKTRSHSSLDFPALFAAGEMKLEKIRRAARRWMAEHNYDGGARIDVVCVERGKVTTHLVECDWDE